MKVLNLNATSLTSSPDLLNKRLLSTQSIVIYWCKSEFNAVHVWRSPSIPWQDSRGFGLSRLTFRRGLSRCRLDPSRVWTLDSLLWSISRVRRSTLDVWVIGVKKDRQGQRTRFDGAPQLCKCRRFWRATCLSDHFLARHSSVAFSRSARLWGFQLVRQLQYDSKENCLRVEREIENWMFVIINSVNGFSA